MQGPPAALGPFSQPAKLEDDTRNLPLFSVVLELRVSIMYDSPQNPGVNRDIAAGRQLTGSGGGSSASICAGAAWLMAC